MGDDAAVPKDEDVAGPDEVEVGQPVETEEVLAPEVSEAGPSKEPVSTRTLALVCGLVAVVALSGLVGWLGYHAHLTRQAQERRDVFLQVGRQGAINLTTIDVAHVDDDVKRILESASGRFYDEFQQRSQPFVEVVKQVKSKSVGTVTEAGLQIPDGDAAATVPSTAEVLVAVTVNTSIANQPDQAPRAWRMRIQVQQDDDGQAKVSNVEFVP